MLRVSRKEWSPVCCEVPESIVQRRHRTSHRSSLICDQPKVQDRRDGEVSSQMYDEGCPNGNTSVDDASGYSKEEDKDLEEEGSDEEVPT